MGNCLPPHGVDSRKLTDVPRHRRRSSCSASVQRDNTCNRLPGCVVEGGGGKGGMRVKIVLTKEAAARLLACSGGSTEKMLERVAGELRKMDSRKVHGLEACQDRWRPALETIPENAHEA